MSILGNFTWDEPVKKHVVARTSKLKATNCGHIYDVLDTVNDIEQGSLIKLGDYVDGELQLRKAETPKATDKIVFICSVPTIYDESTATAQNEYNFYNVRGKACRGYEIVENDIFGVSDNAFTTKVGEAPAVGNIVVVDDNRLYKELDKGQLDATLKTNGFVGRIVGFETYSFETIVLISVIQNTTIVPVAGEL